MCSSVHLLSKMLSWVSCRIPKFLGLSVTSPSALTHREDGKYSPLRPSSTLWPPQISIPPTRAPTPSKKILLVATMPTRERLLRNTWQESYQSLSKKQGRGLGSPTVLFRILPSLFLSWGNVHCAVTALHKWWWNVFVHHGSIMLDVSSTF